MDSIKIRDAKECDLIYLHKVNQSNLPHVSSVSFDKMINLKNQSICYRVAEIKERIAGFLIAFNPSADYTSPNFLWFKNRYENFIYIDRIMVIPEERMKGVASHLYKDIEAFAKQNNYSRLTCEINIRPENNISGIFHSNYGFKEAGTQETEKGKKLVSLQVKELD